MKISQIGSLVMVTLALLFSPVTLAETDKDIPAARKAIEQKLLKVNPKFRIESIKSAGIPGFYAVQIINGPKIYIEKSGDRFIDGRLYDISSGKLVDLTEQEETVARISLMKELNPAEMIIFAPKAPVKAKARIYVFTDIDCGFCRKLHKEVPELNAKGIEVRYLGFPRAGKGSESYKKYVSAWCASDQQGSLTKAKSGESVPEKSCNHPIDKQYDLGIRMGVNGTPAILLENGQMIPGYRPAAQLAETLGL
jgi:thiol:disulfide interchange protein DsbC